MKAALVAMVVLAACLVDRRSESFKCSDNSQCAAGRVCQQGYCVVGNRADDCPSACNAGCDVERRECSAVCNAVTECGTLECPDGWECDFVCDGPGACGTVTCDGDADCYVTCLTEQSCGTVSCGFGICDVACQSPSACGTVACNDACACDVDCNASDCAAVSCPDGCVDQSGECSSVSAGCDRC